MGRVGGWHDEERGMDVQVDVVGVLLSGAGLMLGWCLVTLLNLEMAVLGTEFSGR